MYIVAGAPGSGKSTLLPLSAFEVVFFNADDYAAKLNDGSYRAISQSIRDRVKVDFASFIAKRIQCRESFAVETTLRTDIALLQASQARRAGFRTSMFYLATEDIAINLRRIIGRAQGGGHSAPEKTLRKIHAGSYATFRLAVAGVGESLDQLTVFDNSKPMEYLRPAFRLNASPDGILSLESATVPEYLRPYYDLAATRL